MPAARRPQLARAIDRVKGVPARSGPVYQAVSDLGVRNLVIHSKGRPGAARKQVEHRRAFRRTVRWRTGCAGRISTLKRGYGWDHTRLDDLEGPKSFTGQKIFTRNLIKIGALTA
jgi:transposase, IS5 family